MLPAVAIGAVAVGAAVSAYSRYQEGKAAKRAGKRMAREFERMAAETLQKGEEEAFLSAIRTRQIIGTARTAFAKSNTDAEVSTLSQTAYAGTWEKKAIQNNARREAWGLQRRAAIARAEGADAARAANLGVMATMIGTGAQIAAMAYSPGGATDDGGKAFSPGGSHEGWT